MAELNIDPAKKDDQFYRYKMPALQTKVEGSGNGIKTVITNIVDISQRLNRDVEYPMKFFGNDLGANAKNEDAKWIIMGKHERERLQKSLFVYIERFVLCKACRNPETRTLVDEKKNVWLRCGACGKDSMVDPKEKLLNLILKKETVTRLKEVEKARKEKKEKKEKKDKKSKDQKEEEAFAKQTRAAKESDDIELTEDEKAAVKRNPVEVLKEFLQDDPSEQDIFGKVADVKIEYGLREKQVIKLLGEVVFEDETFVKKIRKYSGVFRRFLSESTEKYVIESIEFLIFDRPELAEKFPIALKRLYDEDVCSEETIMDWYDSKPHKANKDLSTENRKKSKPVIDWLREDEEDD